MRNGRASFSWPFAFVFSCRVNGFMLIPRSGGFARLRCGFNDVINNEYRAEYGKNMINFIRDVRKDLGVPELPIVIGELGMDGVKVNPRYAHKHYAIRKAQEAPSKMPEFQGTVRYARTSPFVVKDGKGYDGGYHYRGRADTFYKIGESFGKAMLELVKDSPKDHRKQVQAAHRQAKARYGFQ